MITEEIQRRLATLKTAAEDFARLVNGLDGAYESKESQIKALDLKIEKLRDQALEAQQKADKILQDAHENASKQQKEAAKLLDDAQNAKHLAKEESDRAKRELAEAQAIMIQANDKQRTADNQWRMMEDRKKKLDEALKG